MNVPSSTSLIAAQIYGSAAAARPAPAPPTAAAAPARFHIEDVVDLGAAARQAAGMGATGTGPTPKPRAAHGVPGEGAGHREAPGSSADRRPPGSLVNILV